MLLSLVLLAAVRSGRADEPAKVEDHGVTPAVEGALLRENWPQVAEQLKDVTAETGSPVLRLLKGHACLALNRNNEALRMFLSVSTDKEREEWKERTASFAGSHPESAIGGYLRGDALARCGMHEEAVHALSKCLAARQDSALALNARGVVFATLGKFTQAREDLLAARRAAPSFAEAHASFGTYIVQRRTDAGIAEKSFETALKHSPSYVLALNGIGACAAVRQDWQRAKKLLTEAEDVSMYCLGEVAELVRLNRDLSIDGYADYSASLLASAAGIEPGMSLHEQLQKFDQLSLEQKQRVVDRTATAAQNPWRRSVPDSVTAGFPGGISGTWNDFKQRGQQDHTAQQQFLDAARERGVTPKTLSVAEMWMGNLSGGTENILGTHAHQHGGVSSEEIGHKKVDLGNWNVVSIYGLSYPRTGGGSDPGGRADEEARQ